MWKWSSPRRKREPGVDTPRTRQPASSALLATIAVVSLMVCIGLVVFAKVDPLRSGLVTRDVLTLAWGPGPLPYYSGWITLTGVLGWLSAGAAGVLAGWVLRRAGRRIEGSMLLFGGLLSTVLGIDDLYVVHEAALSTQGIPEAVTIGVYVLGAAIWGVAYFKEILRGREAVLVVLAALWFGMSLATEALGGRVAFLEEPSKNAAIVCWAAWFWLRSVIALLTAIRLPRVEPMEPTPTDRN